MDPRYIPMAEEVAVDIVLKYGTQPEYGTIIEKVSYYLSNKAIKVTWDEEQLFVEYVDYLVNNAELEVKLPKGGL